MYRKRARSGIASARESQPPPTAAPSAPILPSLADRPDTLASLPDGSAALPLPATASALLVATVAAASAFVGGPVGV